MADLLWATYRFRTRVQAACDDPWRQFRLVRFRLLRGHGPLPVRLAHQELSGDAERKDYANVTLQLLAARIGGPF